METSGKPRKLTSQKSHRATAGNDIEVSTYLEIAEQKTGKRPIAAKDPVIEPEREAIVIIDFGSSTACLSPEECVNFKFIANWYRILRPGRK